MESIKKSMPLFEIDGPKCIMENCTGKLILLISNLQENESHMCIDCYAKYNYDQYFSLKIKGMIE